MQCEICGSPNPDTNNFCGNCGRRLFSDHMLHTVHKIQSTGKALSEVGIHDLYDGMAPEKPSVDVEPTPVPAPIAPIPGSFLDQAVRSEATTVTAKPTRVETVEREPISDTRDLAEPEQTTISGPSFLGLTDSSSDRSDYLLVDDAPRHRGGWILFALIVIAICVGFGYFEWNSIKTGRINIPFLTKSESQTQAPSQPAAQSSNPQAAATPGTPQSNNTDEKLTTTDPGSTTNPTTPANTPAVKPPDTTPSNATPAPETTPKSTPSSAAPATTPDPTTDRPKTAPGKPTETPKTKPTARSTAKPITKTEDPKQDENLVLGEKYLYGRGVPQNCNQALKYFRTAAQNDNAPAMSHLGAMYSSGQCVTMNRPTAYSWFARAQNADPGNQWREKNMNMLWRDMTPEERAAVSK